MKKMPLTIELEPGTYHWCASGIRKMSRSVTVHIRERIRNLTYLKLCWKENM